VSALLGPTAITGFGIVLALVAVVAALVGWFRPDPVAADQERERRTSPRWARPGDVPELIVREPVPSRLTLGHLDGHRIANPPRRSKLVLAPTGAGKTPRCVVPDVLDHHGPAVITSVKADVLHLTLAHRAGQGPVWIFDPTGASGKPSCTWPLVDEITTYADALKTAGWISDSSKVDKQGLEAAEFWDTLGLKLISPLLFLAAHTGESMTTINRWVEYRAEKTVADGLAQLDERPGKQDALAAWHAVCAKPEKTKGSVFGTAEVILYAFSHPEVRESLATSSSRDRFDVQRLLDAGGTLYIVAPSSDQDLFTPVFEALLNRVLRAVERRSAATGLPLDPSLLVMEDEAGNVAPLRRLDRIASSGANQGITLVSVWQDDGQIAQVYGRDQARTIKANHTARQYLPGIADPETLQQLSAEIGPHHVRRRSQQTDADGRHSHSAGLQEEPAAPPHWLRRLDTGTAVTLTGTAKPIWHQVHGWFEDPRLRERVDPDVAAAFDAQFAPTTSSTTTNAPKART
jgi:type IV secretory pathway TraG/TraD family ATPase VirD4